MSSNFDPVPDKCEAAFVAYLEACQAPALTGYQIVSSKRHAPLPIPGVVVSASEDDVVERVHGHGIFDVPLDIYVGTDSSLDKEGDAHRAAAGVVLAHLNDKAAVRGAINTVAEPDVRPVKDFMVYDYRLRGQPTRAVAAGVWETIIKLTVVCQGRDTGA